jgi:hypothetical protein
MVYFTLVLATMAVEVRFSKEEVGLCACMRK